MSEPAAAYARPKSHVVTDADLRRLGVRGTALRLVLYAREQAGFKRTLTPVIPNEEAAARLVVSTRTVMRAKRELAKAGIVRKPGERRTRRYTGSEGGNLADVFVLDRRQLDGLRLHVVVESPETPWGDNLDTPHKEVKPPLALSADAERALGVGRAPARGSPRPLAAVPSPDEPKGAPAPKPSVGASLAEPAPSPDYPASTARAADEPPAAQVEFAVIVMRGWLDAAGRSAWRGLRGAAVLDRAARHALSERASPEAVAAARTRLERELGIGQLSLDDDPVGAWVTAVGLHYAHSRDDFLAELEAAHQLAGPAALEWWRRASELAAEQGIA